MPNLVSAQEEQRISRSMMVWANSYPSLPSAIARVDFEQLSADKPSMALSTIQSAYIVREFITGGRRCEYQYKVIYRIKPGNSNDARLKADEVLNDFGDWARGTLPDLGEGIRVVKNEATTRSSMFAVYENGDEDHQILMKLTYEVI